MVESAGKMAAQGGGRSIGGMDEVDGPEAPSFGRLLRGYRGARGLTQEELAERSGLSVDAISMLERGVRTAPRSGTVESLARALRLDAAEREALAIAASGPKRPAGARAVARTPLAALLSSVWWRRASRAAGGLAGLLAALAICTMGDAPPGAAAARGAGPAAPASEPLPAGPTAIVYYDAGDRTLLRQVGYDDTPMTGTWSTTPGPVLYSGDPIQQVVGISPDGEHAVILGDHRQDYVIVDTRDEVVSKVLSTMNSTEFGAWSNDSRHVCRLGLVDPLRWQLAVMDMLAPDSPPATVLLGGGVTYPPYLTIAACDTAARRAVVVEPLTSTVPAPPNAPRMARLVDLSTGRTVTRVPIGDTTHGVVFSLDCRYLATIDYERGTSSIVSLLTGKTVWTVAGEVRSFSGDDSRVVVNSTFEPLGAALGITRVIAWRTGRVVYSTPGWTGKASADPSGASLALTVTRPVETRRTDVVMVPVVGIGGVIPDALLF
jgi:transcriptional regulator with XRE-family HTH domain